MNITDWIKSLNTSFLGHADNKDHSELTQNWSGTLTDVADKLCGITVSTEREFLDIGEKLQDFYSRSQNMAEMSSQVAGLMSGDEIIHSIEGLTRILNNLEQHLETSEINFGKISEVLQNYLGTFRKISSSLDEFKMLVLNLRMLGFFTRVENAHILKNDTGFTNLTNDMKTFCENIRDKTLKIQFSSTELSSLIRHALSDVTEFRKRQSNHAKLMLKNTVDNHSILSKKHETASEAALLVAGKLKEISDQIGEIVMSLQFHDITRQQICHVKEAIENLLVNTDSGSISDKAVTAIHTCSLQAAQLDQSRDALINAISKIKQSLHAIIQRVQGIVQDTQKVAWSSDAYGLSFIGNIDTGISSVINCLNENAREQDQLTSTMNTVSGMASKMSVFVEEIEYLGLNLQSIALNARIKAAHMGHEGAALDTLSGSIYDLSKESRKSTKALSETLLEMADTAKVFDANLRDIQEHQKINVNSIVQDLKGIMHPLHKVNDRVISALTEMHMLGESLLEDLKYAANEIMVRDEVGNVLDEALDKMEKIICEAQLISTEKLSVREINLSDLDDHYTMKSERDVHEAFIKQNIGSVIRANGR